MLRDFFAHKIFDRHVSERGGDMHNLTSKSIAAKRQFRGLRGVHPAHVNKKRFTRQDTVQHRWNRRGCCVEVGTFGKPIERAIRENEYQAIDVAMRNQVFNLTRHPR